MPELSRTDNALGSLLRIGLLFLVVATALMHGVVEPWSNLLFQLLVAALLFLWGYKAYQDRQLILWLPGIAWPFVGLIGVAAVQSVAWVDRNGLRQSLSYDVEATRSAVLTLCCLLICLLLAANVFNQREAWEGLAKFLPWYGMALAILAILQHFSAGNAILWIREITSSQPFGTFINRDHFAGYMELLVGMPVALIATRHIRGEGRFIYIVAALMMGLAVVLTLSRGGTIGLVLELLVIGALANRRARYLNKGAHHGPHWLGFATVGLTLVAIVAGILWIGAEPIINRFATGSADSSDLSKAQSFESARGAIWRDTWMIIRAHPIFGAGVGAYETAYHIHAPGDDDRSGIAAQAHNDYLQVLADAGIIGGALLIWFLIVVLRGVLAVSRERDPLLAGVALGCSGGVVGMLVHSFFDFNLQLVSHALLFLVLCVVLLAIQEMARHAAILPATDAIRTQTNAPNLVSEVMS